MDVNRIRVKDLMKADAKTVHKDVTLFTAIKMMRDFSVSSLIIEPESDRDASELLLARMSLKRLSWIRPEGHHFWSMM